MKTAVNRIEAELAWAGGVDDWVASATWSPDGRWLAAASIAGPIQLYEAGTGRLHRSWVGHRLGTMSMSWSADGTLLASGGQDGVARLWDPDRDAPLAELEAGADWVEHVAFSPTYRLLATAAGRRLRLWGVDGSLLRSYPDQRSTISDIGWQPVTRSTAESALRLTSAGYGGVTLWSPAADAPRQRFEWVGSILCIAWSPDGRYIATGDQDSTVHFWIVRQRRDLQMWGYPRKITALAWDASSRFLATNGGEQVTVWDCSGRGPEGTQPKALVEHTAPVSAVTFQQSGPLLASGGEDGCVVLWNPGRSRRPFWRTRFAGAVSCVAWAPADDAFVAGYSYGAVRAFRVRAT
jgi:WD40 repeat protein